MNSRYLECASCGNEIEHSNAVYNFADDTVHYGCEIDYIFNTFDNPEYVSDNVEDYAELGVYEVDNH